MSETLCQGIEKDDAKCHWRKDEANPIDKKSRGHKEQGTDQARHDGRILAKQLMPARSPGIAFVDLPVSDTIEDHRCSTCKNHAEQDQAEDPPPRKTPSRNDHRSESEWQGKNRVREPDEGEETGDEAQSF